jgi:hypothetical protein
MVQLLDIIEYTRRVVKPQQILLLVSMLGQEVLILILSYI